MYDPGYFKRLKNRNSKTTVILIASNAMISTGETASMQFSLTCFAKCLPQTLFLFKSFRKIAKSHFYKMTDRMTTSEARSVAIRHQNVFGKLSLADAFEKIDHLH